MTRVLSTGYSAHLAGLTQAVVELYKISAAGMSLFTYTDSKESVTYHGLTYKPYPIKRSKIIFSADLRVDQTSISLATNWGLNRAITSNTLSGAAFSITRVRKDAPDHDNILLFEGEVANISSSFNQLELRAQTLDFLNFLLPRREIQVACNWKLYDKFCSLGLTTYQSDGITSQSSPSGKTLYSSTFSAKSNDYYTLGFIEMTDGDNKNFKRSISDHTSNTITVIPPFPYAVGQTASFKVAPGCKHDIDDCENKFNNLINYGGFPFVPKQDAVL